MSFEQELADALADKQLEPYRAIALAVRKQMLDRLPDDVIDGISKSHIVFGTACAHAALNASNSREDILEEAEGSLKLARDALSFYASEDIYAALAFRDGPGTLPILAADRGQIARRALDSITPLIGLGRGIMSGGDRPYSGASANRPGCEPTASAQEGFAESHPSRGEGHDG